MAILFKQVCPVGILSYPGGPGEAPICTGIDRCHPGYIWFAPDHPSLSRSSPCAIMVGHGVVPVKHMFFTSLSVPSQLN